MCPFVFVEKPNYTRCARPKATRLLASSPYNVQKTGGVGQLFAITPLTGGAPYAIMRTVLGHGVLKRYGMVVDSKKYKEPVRTGNTDRLAIQLKDAKKGTSP